MKACLKLGLLLLAAVVVNSCRSGSYTRLGKALQNPERVERLVLSYQKIGVLPPEIARLRNLRVLKLFKTELQGLPPEIGQLENLERLIISSNALETLPPQIGQLKNLKELSAHHNRLKEIPAETGRLEKLEIMDLGWNNLEKLPEEAGNLTGLKYLYVQQNDLKELPQSLKNLDKLLIFNAERNQLKDIPNYVWEWESIRDLYLAYAASGSGNIRETLCKNMSLELLTISQRAIVPACLSAPRNPVLRVRFK